MACIKSLQVSRVPAALVRPMSLGFSGFFFRLSSFSFLISHLFAAVIDLLLKRSMTDPYKMYSMYCYVSKRKTLTVNPAKCLFGVTELDCYGFHISAQGVSPDKNHIQAIKQMQPPSTATEARSFLGLVKTVAHILFIRMFCLISL